MKYLQYPSIHNSTGFANRCSSWNDGKLQGIGYFRKWEGLEFWL